MLVPLLCLLEDTGISNQQTNRAQLVDRNLSKKLVLLVSQRMDQQNQNNILNVMHAIMF